MTDYAKSLKEKLDIVRLPKEAFDELAKDRLDFGFDNLVMVKTISKLFKVMINASTISPAYLDEAKKQGILIDNFILSHNFYPKFGTGLKKEDFANMNNDYLRFNLPIQAFLPHIDIAQIDRLFLKYLTFHLR